MSSRLTRDELRGLIGELRATIERGDSCRCPGNDGGFHEITCAWAQRQHVMKLTEGIR